MDFDNLLETITPTASTTLTISTTGALALPSSTTANRPSTPSNGFVRYNTDLSSLELYSASSWVTMGTSLPAATRVATTGNITLTAPGATIDGITMAAGDRVLVRAQTTASQNGIYIWNGAASTMTRAPDCSTDWGGQVVGRNTYVLEGNTYAFFNFRFVVAFGGAFDVTAITVTSGWWQAQKFSTGDSLTATLAASVLPQRTLTLLDTNASIRQWRFTNTAGADCTIEFSVGNNADLANVANEWWDAGLHTDTQDGFRIARRTGNVIDPKFFVDASGRLTVGNTVFASGATGAAFATTNNVNMYVNGLTGIRMPSGATADRPGTPVAGTQRYNTTLGVMEFYNGSGWIRSGQLIQQVTASFASTSSNGQIPYDNTTPLSTEGIQLWSQSFTPVLANSTIVITVSSMVSVNSAADVFVSGALFNGTTCFRAGLLHFSTNTGEGSGYTLVGTQTSGSTSARTYAFRAGANSNVTVFYGQGTGGQAYGGVSTGTYTIQEFAP